MSFGFLEGSYVLTSLYKDFILVLFQKNLAADVIVCWLLIILTAGTGLETSTRSRNSKATTSTSRNMSILDGEYRQQMMN